MRCLKITVFFAVLMFLFSLLTVFADNGQNFYGNAADYLNKIYGIDNNAGLTAFPVLNIPMGGRSEGMAGAFSAVSDDISFLEFNPAGSSTLERTELAFFHNNWIADTKIEAAAYTMRFGDLGIAGGFKWLYLPFTEYNIYGDRVSGGYYSEGTAVLNASYNFLSGYYFSGLSVGVNLKGAFRIVPDYTDNFDNVISGSGMSQSAFMVMADIGLLTRFNFLKSYVSRDKNASAAFVIRNLGPPSKGEPLPAAINAAVSYKPIRPLTIALDFTLPVNFVNLSLSEKPYAALGLSVNVTGFLSMRAGFLYKAGSSRINIGSAILLKHAAIDINYTLDMLSQMQPLNRISVGVRLDMGDGGRKEILNKADEFYYLGMEAFSSENFADARLCWEEALRLNPGFDPAKEAIAMLDEREGLIRRIDDMYRLEF
ncbi:MAG: UPF0164 family protein [Treponema sp.]|nr:UPF0164 family protein [Treponema sp.]